jgi:hypothetical protein
MPTSYYLSPFGHPEVIRAEGIVSLKTVEAIWSSAVMNGAEGLSLEIVQGSATNGYMFHIREHRSSLVLLSFKGEVVDSFGSLEEIVMFINHSVGLKFDHNSWKRSEEINRKKVMERISDDDSLSGLE